MMAPLNYLKRNKKGWIKIIEAFIAIMLIAAVLLVVLNQREASSIGEIRDNRYQEYTGKQILILRKIQLNDSLREWILSEEESSLPLERDEVPGPVRDKIDSESPSYFNCTSKVCGLSDECKLDEQTRAITTGDVFVQEVGIFADSDEYAPRKLKLFCWEE